MTVCPVTEKSVSLQSYGKVVVGGNRPVHLYYEIHGTGAEKVVMIPGICTPCYSWDIQYEYLAATGDYTVLVLDNRGTGKSDSPYELYTISEMAHDALDLLDNLGWTSKVHLVGISMGGMVSLELATIAPKRLKTLTLTSTDCKNRMPTIKTAITIGKVAISETNTQKINSVIKLAYPDVWVKMVPTNKMYPTNQEMLSCMMHRWLNQTDEQPLNGLVGQTAACLRHYVSKSRLVALRKTGLPILIVTGTLDNVIRPINSYKMHLVLGGRLEVFVGCGHGVPQQEPDRYNALLVEHFSQSDL